MVCPYHVANIVFVNRISKENSLTKMGIPKASVMMAKEMIRGRFEFSKGLERNLQSILEPLEVFGKKDTFELGFQPATKDKKEMQTRKKAEKKGKQTTMSIPPLHYTFPRLSGIILSKLENEGPIEEIETSLS